MIFERRRKTHRNGGRRAALWSFACLSALAAGVAVRLTLHEPPPPARAPLQPQTSAPCQASPAADLRPEPRPKERAAPKRGAGEKRIPPQSSPPADLSAYKPRARGTEGESCLPDDRSLRAKDMRKTIAPPPEEEGKGFVHDVVRGAQKAIKTVDDATLEGARWALGDLASPDKATVRPEGDGLKLHIKIPAHTLKLKK